MSSIDPEAFVLLKREVDTLQTLIAEESKPWYRTPSTIISVIALIFSFGTTAFSYYQIRQNEVREKRIELRSLIQRITQLPRENFEFLNNYQDREANELISLFAQEHNLLALQAAEIADDIPNELAAVEYFSVATALMDSSALERVPTLLEIGISKVNNPADHTALLRVHGDFLINTGQVSEGRKKFEKALIVWQKYPKVTQFYRNQTNGYTEMFWARSEFSAGNVEAANEHIRKASEIGESLPKGPVANQFNEEVGYWKKQIEEGNSRLPLTLPSP